MNLNEAWSRLSTVTNVSMRRWTQSRAARATFRLERQGDRADPVYQVIIDGTDREPRRFGRARFSAFWKLWNEGKRNPDDFRNVEPEEGMFKLSYYLLTVAAAIEESGNTHPKPSNREFKYGEKQTWQMAVDALRGLGGTATLSEVKQRLSEQYPLFKLTNVRPDLDLVSVNAFGRANWSPNQRPRIVDGSNPFDLLFVEDESPRTYTLYKREVHGIWELAAVPGDTKLRPRLLEGPPTEKELDSLRKELDDQDAFDPHDDTDARKKTLKAIAVRQGQSGFRKALLRAYEHRCAITGCDVPQALEAAHIRPYLGEHTNVVANGLLLRSDLHTLFDLRLVRIRPTGMAIEISSRVNSDHYRAIAGTTMRLPSADAEQPSVEALRWHWNASALNFD